MPNMTGRPGYRTMEMIGGSSAPYLACTPCIPLFCTSFDRGGARGAFRLPGAGGGSFPLYGGTFARSYSVSINANAPLLFETPQKRDARLSNEIGNCQHFPLIPFPETPQKRETRLKNETVHTDSDLHFQS